MLTIILIGGLAAFFYRSFAEMAHEFNRSRVKYGILGLGIMIITYLILGLSLGFFVAIVAPQLTTEVGFMIIMEFTVIVVAGLITFLVKYLMNRSLKKNRERSELLDKQTYTDSDLEDKLS